MTTSHQDPALWLAKQQISELQQQYAFATDLIGQGSNDGIEAGRAIYHQIFTPTAAIVAAGVEPKKGPDAWVELVAGALKDYQATQHLIGSQRVTVTSLPDQQGQGGHAFVSSYLQAWHAQSDGKMWLFIGTYESEASYNPDLGWQLSRMTLHKTSGDYREINERP